MKGRTWALCVAILFSSVSNANFYEQKDYCSNYNHFESFSPGDYSDGTFGHWSLKRVPFPNGYSLEIDSYSWMQPMVYMELRPDDPKKSSGYRNELSDPLTVPPGSAVHYRFSTVFTEQSFPDRGTLVIAQWKEHDGESPGVSLRTLPNKRVALIIKYLDNGRKMKKTIKVLPVEPEQIYAFDFYIQWPADRHWGSVEFHVNGEKVAQYEGKIGSFTGTGHFFKYGMYNWLPNTKIHSLYQGQYYRRMARPYQACL